MPMTNIDCPACEASIATDLPAASVVRCDACAIEWDVTDPEPRAALIAA
jgi:hypothetical protein